MSEQGEYLLRQARLDYCPTEPSLGNDSIHVGLVRRDNPSSSVSVILRVDPVEPNGIVMQVDFGDNTSARLTPDRDALLFNGDASNFERYSNMKSALRQGVESLRGQAQGRIIWSSVLHSLERETRLAPAAV